jgi:hypothetical protein
MLPRELRWLPLARLEPAVDAIRFAFHLVDQVVIPSVSVRLGEPIYEGQLAAIDRPILRKASIPRNRSGMPLV